MPVGHPCLLWKKCLFNYSAHFKYGLFWGSLLFWPCHAAFGILVPQPGVEPVSPAVEAWGLNHCTAWEV